MLDRLLPRFLRRLLASARDAERGRVFARSLQFEPAGASLVDRQPNPLGDYFAGYANGPGIWKWQHYFDIYHRHLSRFRGQPAVVVEIGIYSGGSLRMWASYFGARAQIVGVDIEPACQAYQDPQTKIIIGDQGDPEFWRQFSEEVPMVDVVIDDGNHCADDQLTTLRALFPRLRPGGVYICEDVHGKRNAFASFVHGIAAELNASRAQLSADNERRIAVKSNGTQSAIDGIHLYPFVTVIEKRLEAVPELIAPKRGTRWQPFLG